jgi:hypothetical protein
MIRRSLCALAVVVGAAVPAPALAAGTTSLTLTLVGEGWARAVTLQCEPPDGGHPAPAEACAALAAVDGDPSALPVGTHPCTLEYAPVTARLTGVWQDTAVGWTNVYGNPCDLHRATDPLFRF